MKRETELFFDSIVREDRSVLDLLTADYSFVNERLAQALRHSERHRQRVPARARCREYRRGILGQGSILMLTSVADRTSPVQRGKWVMEVLLGIPPPPPPPNVPALDDTKAVADGQPLSTRERMEEHRKNPACSVVPPGDRSARPGARQLRRHRRLAHQGQRRAGRFGRRSLRRHARWKARAACARRC